MNLLIFPKVMNSIHLDLLDREGKRARGDNNFVTCRIIFEKKFLPFIKLFFPKTGVVWNPRENLYVLSIRGDTKIRPFNHYRNTLLGLTLTKSSTYILQSPFYHLKIL